MTLRRCTRLLLAGLFIGLAPADPGAVQRSGSNCRGSAETLNWTREKLAKPDLTEAELGAVLAHLELSTQACPTDGDLWYYRSVAERRSGEPDSKSAYSERKAAEWHSSALGREQRSTPGVPPAVVSAAVGRKWALIVGVNEFADKRIQTLRYAAKDAADFNSTLVDPAVGRFSPSQVRLLTDADATLRNVRGGIGWLRANVAQNDLVVVYLASHGSPRELDPAGVSYVLLHDTDPSTSESTYASALQMIDLVEDLTRDLTAARVVLVLDTCFSGDATRLRLGRGATLFAPALSAMAGRPGRVVFAAATGDQSSFESPSRNNGYFTYFLIDALRKGRGQWPMNRLFEQVRSAVSESVKRELNASQTPIMSGSGDINNLRLGMAEGEPFGMLQEAPAPGASRDATNLVRPDALAYF